MIKNLFPPLEKFIVFTPLKVSFKAGNPGVFLEGGIHAREWVSTATVTFILNALLTSADPRVRAMAERHDWYIFPVFNPDGYTFTHSSPQNRLWRKTLKPYVSPFGFTCYGTDPNRNWGFKWNREYLNITIDLF